MRFKMKDTQHLEGFQMIRSIKRGFVQLLAASVVFTGFAQSAQAALITTEQVASSAAAAQNRIKIAAAFERTEVQAELQKMGINHDEAQARIAALTDAETASVAHQLDALPAGGDGILGTIVFIFLILLVTDILGLTKVYPFTRSVR
jgi:hypothetical protein